MEKAYWLSRKRASLEMAENAASSEARLAHYDLAGRYSVKAASVSYAIDWADALPSPIDGNRTGPFPRSPATQNAPLGYLFLSRRPDG